MQAVTNSSYVLPVTNEQLWRAVGMELGRIRARKGFSSTHAMYRGGGPATGTIEDIENGRVGNLDRVDAYCTALGVALADVLRTVLEGEDEHADPLSADALWVGRMYQEGPDAAMRGGMLGLAKAQSLLLSAAPASAQEPLSATRAIARGSRARGRKSHADR